MLRALSHTERRAFLKACLGAAQSAGELAGLSDLSPAAVSEHLKVLRKTGLLILEKRGRSWLYTTDPAMIAVALDGLRELLPD